MATLVAAGLLAIVGWETKPWRGLVRPDVPKQVEPQPSQSQAQPQPPPQPETTAPSAVSSSTDAKPSALSAAEVAPPKDVTPPHPEPVAPPEPKKDTHASPPVRRVLPVRPPPQPIMVISSPGGALATLDRQADTVCTTPCSIEAAPGHHTIGIAKKGYDVETRDVEVASIPVELPAVVLRAVQGTLMLTSQPEGAAVLVNGKRYTDSTPAQINLAPGTYSITVEWKDGKQSTRTVEIRNGINYQKFLAGQ